MNRRVMILALAVAAALSASAAVPASPPLLNGTVRGVVTDVNGPTVTIMRNVVLDTSGARLTRRGKPVSADVLTRGMRVTVAVSTIRPNRPGVLVAETITVDPADAALTGPLDAVASGAITLLGQQVAVSDETFFGGFVEGNAVHAASDLKAGLPVEVEIAAAPDGAVATSVIAIGPAPRAPQPPPANHGTAVGVVSSIADHVWTVGGTKVFVVDQKTVITGAPAVGDTVSAEGLRTPDGAIIASTVQKQ